MCKASRRQLGSFLGATIIAITAGGLLAPPTASADQFLYLYRDSPLGYRETARDNSTRAVDLLLNEEGDMEIRTGDVSFVVAHNRGCRVPQARDRSRIDQPRETPLVAGINISLILRF